jgi:hypothetical protein
MINRSSYRACCLCAIRRCGEYAADKAFQLTGFRRRFAPPPAAL